APREGGVDLWGPAWRHVRRLALNQPIAQLTFSPDGASLAGGGPGAATVTLWDVAARREPRQLAMPGGAQDPAFSRDGPALSAASARRRAGPTRGAGHRAVPFPSTTVGGSTTSAPAPRPQRSRQLPRLGRERAGPRPRSGRRPPRGRKRRAPRRRCS